MKINYFLPRIATVPHNMRLRTSSSNFKKEYEFSTGFINITDCERFQLTPLFSISSDVWIFQIAYFDIDKNFLGFSSVYFNYSTETKHVENMNKFAGETIFISNELGAGYIKIFTKYLPIYDKQIELVIKTV